MRHRGEWLGFAASVAIGVCAGGTPASAAPAALCREAESAMKSAQGLAEATTAALQASPPLRDNECLYPAKLLRYGSFDVLLTLANAPGTVCHGCAAQLSAFVFRRRPEGLALVSRFAGFGEAGSNGDPGKIDRIQIAGGDGFAVEHGATFQGHTSSLLDLYVFKGGKLVRLKPSLELSASNEGAVEGESKTVKVDGSWAVQGSASSEISVDYKIAKGGRTTTSRATWRIERSVLSPKSGGVPPEYAEASGNGG